MVARTMIGMVLAPIGIPSEAIIVMLMALDPIIDPITTIINVYPNCAATCLIAAQDESKNFKYQRSAAEGKNQSPNLA